MTKKEIQDILGENIQLYGLMTYFANDSKRQALENTYSNARIKKDNAERRLNQFIEQIKWNLQGPSAFLLSLIVGYILFKKIITIKSTFWFIVLLLITGFILAPMIRKYAYNLAKSSVLKKHPDLKEELESAEEKAAYYKKVTDRYKNLDKDLPQKTIDNFESIGMIDKEEKWFFNCLYYFKYLNDGECETINACRIKYKSDKRVPKDYPNTPKPNKTESFEDYLARCINVGKFGLRETEREKILNSLPKLKPEYEELIELQKTIKED